MNSKVCCKSCGRDTSNKTAICARCYGGNQKPTKGAFYTDILDCFDTDGNFNDEAFSDYMRQQRKHEEEEDGKHEY